MLVPLQDAAAGLTSCDRANVPRFRIGKFEAWFGYDSGYDSETLFLDSGSFVASFLFLSVNLPQLLRAMARPARRPRAGPEYIEYEKCEDLNTHLWFISACLPACLLSGCSSDAPLAQLCFQWFLFNGFLVWLPASQPATARVILLISLISLSNNTASPSQPPNQQQQLP